MTDLISRVNKLDGNTYNNLLKKYEKVLVLIKDESKIPVLAYSINLAYNYLQKNYNNETPTWKTWCIMLIKKLILEDEISTKEEIFNNIDSFLEYKKSEYNKYVSKLSLYSDDFYKDLNFMFQYTKT